MILFYSHTNTTLELREYVPGQGFPEPPHWLEQHFPQVALFTSPVPKARSPPNGLGRMVMRGIYIWGLSLNGDDAGGRPYMQL